MKTRAQIQNNLSATNGIGNTKKFLTIHQTDNWGRGANAAAHANLQSRGYGAASWHWTVDDKEAVQSYAEDVKCWHAGDGGGAGNTQSIAVEMCLNSDGNYQRTFDNGARLAAQILKRNGIPLSRMVQHNYWSGKNCPSQIRGRGEWARFRALVAKYMGQAPAQVSPAPKGKVATDKFWGRNTTRELQRLYGTTVDGVVSGQSTIWRQRYGSRFTTGWQWTAKPAGSRLIVAMQRQFKAKGHKISKIDGLVGPEFVAAMIAYYGGGTLANAIGNMQIRVNKGKK